MRILVLLIACCLLLAARPASGQEYPWCSTGDKVYAVVEGGDLILHHDLATYNCCSDYFTYTTEVVWDGRDDRGGTVSSGVYFYRLEAEAFSRTKRMILLR